MDRRTLKQYIIQYTMTKGTVPKNELTKKCKRVAADKTNIDLNVLVPEINSKIRPHSFAIELTTCEITNESLVIWCNTRNDDLSKRQKHFSKVQLEYFQAILLEILSSTKNRILFITAVNIASTLTEKFSLSAGEKALETFIQAGYFVTHSDQLYLGARTIVEFRPFLMSNNEIKVTCELCNELVFKCTKCNKCKRPFHSYCIQKYLTLQNECPTCKKRFTEMESDNETAEQ